MKILELRLQIQIDCHRECNTIFETELLTLQLTHMIIRKIGFSNQDIDVIKEPFVSTSLTIEVPEIPQDSLPEHDGKLVHVLLEDVNLPIFFRLGVDVESFFHQEVRNFEFEIFGAEEEVISSVDLRVCNVREQSFFVNDSGHDTRLSAHKILQGLQEYAGVYGFYTFAKVNQVFYLVIEFGIKYLTLLEI